MLDTSRQRRPSLPRPEEQLAHSKPFLGEETGRVRAGRMRDNATSLISVSLHPQTFRSEAVSGAERRGFSRAALRWESRMRPRYIAAVVVAVLFAPASASASIKVASWARNPTLKVVAGGAAEVDWTSGGRRHSVVISRNGSQRYGAHLRAREVSFPTTAVSVPMALAVRQTPNGNFWALQAWRRLRTGPLELRFSRRTRRPRRSPRVSAPSGDAVQSLGREHQARGRTRPRPRLVALARARVVPGAA